MPSSERYTKRLLPSSLASQTPHGPLDKTERRPGEQAALEKRKNEILQSMSREQIDAAYSGQAVKINEHLQNKARRNTEMDTKIERLKADHDMEMRVIRASLKMQDQKDNRFEMTCIAAEAPATIPGEADDDSHEEGEIQVAE